MMKTRVLLLASLIVVTAACGNKGNSGNTAAAGPNLQTNRFEQGSQQMSPQEFLYQRPHLELQRDLRSDVRVQNATLDIRGGSFAIQVSTRNLNGYRTTEYWQGMTLVVGPTQVVLRDTAVVTPFRTVSGQICANVSLSQKGSRPALFFVACQQNVNF